LLPAIAAKHLITFAYTTIILFAMGRTIRGRSDLKKHPTAAGCSEKQQQQASSSITQIEDTTCLICQEPVGTRNAEGVKEGLSMLPCGHRFGSVCIKRYLGLTADEQPLCPMCRHPAYHDACGHPVLPFLLRADGTHPDLVTDDAGRTRPPRGPEDLVTTACEYCLMPEEQRAQQTTAAGAGTGRHYLLGRLSAVKKKFRWLRALVPLLSRRTLIANLDEVDIMSLGGPVAGGDERRLTRQEARNRRRAPVHDGVWEGPWMDVQTRDVGWEEWWNAQAPRAG
jgi:HUS1 checkpoint protein